MRADRRRSDQRVKVGISACFFHADAKRAIFTGKTLQYVEQSIAHWVMSSDALAVMIPSPVGDTQKGEAALDHYAEWLDALVLEGGSDVWPGSYGEEPMQEHWRGDRIRDEYETGLLRAFAARGKPVLGICRGLQMMNVAHGGTLFQDIGDEVPGAFDHEQKQDPREPGHPVRILEGTALEAIVGVRDLEVNSTHHQSVRDPGTARVSAVSPDLVVEAIELSDRFAIGVQWHPELLAGREHLLLYKALVEKARSLQ